MNSNDTTLQALRFTPVFDVLAVIEAAATEQAAEADTFTPTECATCEGLGFIDEGTDELGHCDDCLGFGFSD